MKTKQSRVYTLTDPNTRKVRFVGCSSKPAELLAAQDPRYNVEPGSLGHWKMELLKQGKAPFVTFVETVSKDIWQKKLAEWTKLFKEEGANLFENPWSVEGHDPRSERYQTVATLRTQLKAMEERLAKLEGKA